MRWSGEAAEIILATLPDATVTRSSEIGRIGLLERENAAILNACLRDLAQHDRRRVPPGDRRAAASPRRSTSPRTTAR